MNKIITTILMLVSGMSIAQTTILMNEVNGVYYVPCEVNGIKMNFIFDTGASNVSISKTEAEFLIKQKLLTKEDFIGRVNYRIADGSIKDGIEVRLKEIKIKDLILKDVTATIVSESSAPLLLGQSALSKLGKFEVDRNVLKIYPNNSRNDFAFLGIDLTKRVEDFGLSGVNLDQAKPLYPAPFEICKISKNHFLKEIDFDKQRVVFDKKGNIAMIMLQKELYEGTYGNEIKAKELFEKIKNLISDLYGKNDEEDEEMIGFAKWSSVKYEIAVNQKSDNTSIELVYVPKITLNDNSISVSRADKPVDEKLNTDVKLEKIVQKMIDTGESEDKIAKIIKGFDQSREEFAKILTGTLNNEKYQIECLTYKGLLVVKIKKRFYDDKPEDYVLSPFMRNLAYDLFYEARKYKGFTEKLKTLFEGVVFQNDFTFNDEVKYEVNLGITCNDNEALLESINKEDFKSLLFTVKD
ncbi:TIGR02281 family clan AA aspartic protease [Flavobacterium sp. ZT3R17]|uniref:retropepsin-like aspartic protease family protein n=1 Tax=Flavobacterium cryoconiti TaxID=3398736 RepID=UPI003A857159